MVEDADARWQWSLYAHGSMLLPSTQRVPSNIRNYRSLRAYDLLSLDTLLMSVASGGFSENFPGRGCTAYVA
jgi:hypothetical protein